MVAKQPPSKNKNVRNEAARKIQRAFRKVAERRKGIGLETPTPGPVSTINTAPVAIGNSLSGFKSQVFHTAKGAKVVGRDYAFTPVATGTVTGWTLEGGMPLTPCCMATTILRNFVQMYNKYRFTKLIFHYITSSSTATTGDVVFYFQKDTNSPMVEWTNNSFLPYVLSDSNTVIGPQWTNHSMIVQPDQRYRSTDYGIGTEPDLYSQGDFFLFSKTSSTESPGYVIMDYEIEFSQLSINPRAGLLPTTKALWNEVAIVYTLTGVSGTTQLINSSMSTTGIGATTITAPTFANGEVYKLIIDVTNSTFAAGIDATNFMRESLPGGTQGIVIKDGFTYYMVVDANTLLQGPFGSITQALTDANNAVTGYTGSYTTTTIRGWIKLITWDINTMKQGNY